MIFGSQFVEDLVHAEILIEGLVEEKFEFGDFAELLSDSVGEGKAEPVEVFVHGGHHLEFVIGIEYGEIDFGALQIGGHHDAGDGDHGFIEDVGSFIHQDHTKGPSEEFVDLFLPLCFHGVRNNDQK